MVEKLKLQGVKELTRDDGQHSLRGFRCRCRSFSLPAGGYGDGLATPAWAAVLDVHKPGGRPAAGRSAAAGFPAYATPMRHRRDTRRLWVGLGWCATTENVALMRRLRGGGYGSIHCTGRRCRSPLRPSSLVRGGSTTWRLVLSASWLGPASPCFFTDLRRRSAGSLFLAGCLGTRWQAVSAPLVDHGGGRGDRDLDRVAARSGAIASHYA
jgi:hypothetical protein